MAYGAVVWGFNLSIRNTAKLNKIQHLASLMITRGQHASAQIALDTILDLEPINIFLDADGTATMRATSTTLKEQGHWRLDNPIDTNNKNQTNMEKITIKLISILENDYAKKTDKIIPESILDINYSNTSKGRYNR